jgi:ferritin-like metal-binding protein YciE
LARRLLRRGLFRFLAGDRHQHFLLTGYIIKEADETAGEIEDKAVLDAAIVANAQAVEHYEICRYGTLIAWAEELGHDEIVRFLTTNLNEEKAANTKLNTVALRKGVNSKASTAA